MKKAILFLVLFLSFNSLISQSVKKKKILDSISYLINKSDDETKSTIERLAFANSAKSISIEVKSDSLINESYRRIAILQWKLKNYNLYKKISQEYLKLSTQLNDSFNMAKANNYLGFFYKLASKSDSAYYHYYQSEKIFRNLDSIQAVGKQLSQIAIVQKNEKDFIGSEITCIEGIKLIAPLKDWSTLRGFYNTLGIVYNEIGQFDEALKYHEKNIELLEKSRPKDYREDKDYNTSLTGALNNIAFVYKNSKNYKKALENFDFILRDKFTVNRPEFHAMVMDNYAHTKFLMNDTEELPKLYFDALEICDSIDDQYDAIAINIHLSEYYNRVNKLDSARYYGHKAKDLAEKFHNDDYLKALLNLSKIEDDSLSVKYYKEYIALNDSLVDNERKVRNKFARIRFETKEIERINEQYSKERLYLFVLSVGLLLTIFLTYSVISQRAKNKELKLNQLQQEANEEIYNLMLTQQDKIEEGRTKEKKRISEELHDGILGRLFGTRLSLDSLNMSTGLEAAKNRTTYIEELKSIEQEIRRISHDLNSDFVMGSGYFDMIETLVENQTQAYQLNYDLKKDDGINWDAVSNKTKINIYRIIQETLQNIYKHANAKHVSIKFELINSDILLEIKDDGEGFDVDKARKGIGLKNIKSRVDELHGKLKIDSEKQNGTTILVKVPE